MKSIFAQFLKKKSVSPASDNDAPKLQHSFRDTSSDFLPSSKMPILLAALLFMVLSFFCYQYLTQADKVASFPAPKAASALSDPSASQNTDSVATARKLFENRQLDESIETYHKLLGKAPRDAQMLNDLGVLYLKKQAFKESEEYLKRSLDEAPECVVCLNNLGYLKTLKGESAEAEALLKKALTLSSTYIDPYFNLGVLYEKNGDLANSATAYNEFLSRSKDPNSPFALKLKQHVNTLLEK